MTSIRKLQTLRTTIARRRERVVHDERLASPHRFLPIALLLLGLEALLPVSVSPACLALGASTAAAQPAWTEKDVLERAKEADVSLRLAEAEAEAARSNAEAAHPYPAASVGFEYEGIPSLGSRQTQIVATIPIDFMGNRDLARSLAKVEASHVATDAAEARSDAAAWALARFYTIVAEAERVKLLDENVKAVEEAARVLEQRLQAGASSGYEQTRIALELELLRTHIERAKRELLADRIDLGTALEPGMQTPPTMTGSLETAAPLSFEEALAAARRALPELLTAQATVEKAEKALEASKGLRVPRLHAMGGLNTDSSSGLSVGYIFGASLELDFGFEQNSLRTRATGQLAIARARLEAIERSLQRDVRRAHARLLAARAERKRFETATDESSETMLRSAQAAYTEGELGLVQLLDAQRAHAEITLRRLDLAEEAKRAEVALRRVMGDL